MSKRTNAIASKVMKLAHQIKAQFSSFSAALKAAWAQVKAPKLSEADIERSFTNILTLAELAFCAAGISSSLAADYALEMARKASENFEKFLPYSMELVAGHGVITMTPIVLKNGVAKIKWQKI